MAQFDVREANERTTGWITIQDQLLKMFTPVRRSRGQFYVKLQMSAFSLSLIDENFDFWAIIRSIRGCCFAAAGQIASGAARAHSMRLPLTHFQAHRPSSVAEPVYLCARGPAQTDGHGRLIAHEQCMVYSVASRLP